MMVGVLSDSVASVKMKVNTTAAREKAGPQEPSSAQYRLRKLGYNLLLRHRFLWPGAKKSQKQQVNKGKTGGEPMRSIDRKTNLVGWQEA